MKDKFEPIPDPTPEQGFEGLYAGTIENGSEYEPGEYSMNQENIFMICVVCQNIYEKII